MLFIFESGLRSPTSLLLDLCSSSDVVIKDGEVGDEFWRVAEGEEERVDRVS